jgi:serine/threonine protein kinase
MPPPQESSPLDPVPGERLLDGNELTTAVAPMTTAAGVDSNSASSTGSSRNPGVVIVGGGEVHPNSPAGLALSDEKTVISKRPLAHEPPTPTPSKSSPSKAVGESLLGCQLDHYELVEFVGGGGMGSVFRARDTRLGRDVAVKVLARDQSDEETIRRFRNEAQSAARLDHPNIARVHYVGESSGWNYIVFEYIEGINLRDLVQRDGPLSLEDALRYTYAVAEALGHAWEREVVHRDIKPSNLLVTSTGALKLVDMGLARMQQVDSSSDDLTASGVTLGTFDYISPEQARDPRMADVRSDIYSLGCTLFFLLTGQPPFPEGTALQKLLSHSQEDPPDVRSFRPELSPRVTALLHKMLAKRPGQRQQTPADVMRDVSQVAEHLGIRLGITRSVQLAPAEPSLAAKTLPIIIPALVLLAAIILVDRLWPTADANAVAELPALHLQPAASKAAPSPESAKPVAMKPPVLKENGRGKPVEAPAPPPDSETSDQGSESATPAPSPARESPMTSSGKASTSGKTAPPPASPAPLTKIVVRPRPESDEPAEPGIRYTLADAVELARLSEPRITVIEIEVNGETETRPFEIAQTELTIRAAENYAPIVVFRPMIGTAESQRMIRVLGGDRSFLHVRGLEMRLELPKEPSSLAWSLFSIGQLYVLNINDCVLTVANADSSGLPLHYSVSVLEMQPPRMPESMMEPNRDLMQSHTTVQLGSCIVRGAADFIRFIEERPCGIVWEQGLLATTEHFMTTTGVTEQPKSSAPIRIDLEAVTLAAQKGIYHLSRRNDAAYQLNVDVRLERCNIANNEDSPWFELDDGPTAKQLQVRMGGNGNRYLRPNLLFARVRPQGETATELTLDDAVRDNYLQNFGQSTATLRGWEHPADPSVPIHEHRKENYVPSGTFATDTGFKLDQLPADTPEAAPAEPETTDSESTPE